MDALAELMQKISLKQSELGFEPLTAKDYEQAKADAYNSGTGNLDKEDGYNCDICKNRGMIASVVYNEQFGYWSETVSNCKCMKARKAIRRLHRSGLKNVVKDYSFEKYETAEAWQKTIKETAIRFCQDEDHNFFFIGGQSGAGKTHICTAIAVHYIRKGKEVRYMLWRDEITRIKSVVNEHDQYGSLMDSLKQTDVLYIDDLFKSGKGDDGNPKPPTAADINAAFEIINYRYNNKNLITIISSERTLAELVDIDEAVAGRIAERSKAGGYCINLKKDKSRNWRMKGCGEI